MESREMEWQPCFILLFLIVQSDVIYFEINLSSINVLLKLVRMSNSLAEHIGLRCCHMQCLVKYSTIIATA